jgi:dienelactone hydrolase
LSEQAQSSYSYLWVCPKCHATNREDLIFCANCAYQEGLPEKEAAPENKIGRLSEMLGKAVEWALGSASFKSAEVLEAVAKKGFRAKSILSLRKLPAAEQEKIAGTFVTLNQTAATGAGFGAGFPGGLVAFATIPADISAVIYFSMRCVSGIGQTYGFETESESGRILKFLAFAHACELETVVIGGRRFEIFALARYFESHPQTPSTDLQKCVLKQLAAFMTRDFAKTSWANFFPVVGGVVSGMDNFWYVRQVSQRSKLFFQALLQVAAPLPEAVEPVQPVLPAALPVIIELPGYELDLPGGKLPVELLYVERTEPVPLVVVMTGQRNARDIAEKLAENGYAALFPSANTPDAPLGELVEYLATHRPAFFPPDVRSKKPGLFATAEYATLALAANLQGLGALVLVNPTGAAQTIRVNVPVLLHWSENAPELDASWLDRLKVGEKSIVSIATYPGTSPDFLDSHAPGYNKQAANWAWDDTLEWLQLLS